MSYLFFQLAFILCLLSHSYAGTTFTDSTPINAHPYASLAAGRDFTCAVLMDHRIQCWGLGDKGQLGRLSNLNVGYAVDQRVNAGVVQGIPSNIKADAVIAGECFSGAILKNASQPSGPSEPGQLLIWGCCESGQCGQGSTTTIGDSAESLVYPNGLIRGLPGDRMVIAAVAGDKHVCVILNATTSGKTQDVTCWGSNTFGQLGRDDTLTIGDNEQLSTSLKIVNLGNRNIVGMCAGFGHTCVLDEQGGVSCFGLNTAGQLGLGHTLNVGSGGSAPKPNDVGLIDFGNATIATQIACGSTHTCALLGDQSIRCWGNSTLGQTGLGRTDLVASVPETLPSLTGPVYLFPGTKAIAIFAGGDSTAVLLHRPLTNSRLLTFGANSRGQLGLGHTNNIGDGETPGDGSGSFPFFGNVDGKMPYFVSIGKQHMCVILIWDHVACVGAGHLGQLGHLSTNDIGDNERASKGGLVALSTWGVLNYTQTGPYPDQIAISAHHGCAILDDRRSLSCWGINTEGYLGLGFTNASGSPPITPPGAYSGSGSPSFVDVGGKRIMRLSVGTISTCIIREDNLVICFGRNFAGVLGCGRNWDDIVGDNEPAVSCIVPNLGDFRFPVQVSCGEYSCVAVMNDQTAFVWGNDERYGLGMHSTGNRNVPLQYTNRGSGQIIAASTGSRMFSFITEDGAVTFGTGQNDENWFSVCCGWSNLESNNGYSTNPGLWPRFISLGSNHFYSIRSDGILVSGGYPNLYGGWGNNHWHRINDGMSNLDNWQVSVGGTGFVIALYRLNNAGVCYITSDFLTRCWGQPAVTGYGNGEPIGDNEHPMSYGPVEFPDTFGIVDPVASSGFSSHPFAPCMIGSSGQPACWGVNHRFRLGLLNRGYDESCGDNEKVSALGTLPMGNGNSVGVYPPTVLSVRPLAYPLGVKGDPLGTVLEIKAKHIGISTREPRQLVLYLGNTAGCDSLSRLSPTTILCSLSAANLLALRQSIQSASKSFVVSLKWAPSSAPQLALNLGRLVAWERPTVTAVSPSIVDSTVQQRITIEGTGFGSTPSSSPIVFIGKEECTALYWQSSTQLSCLTPLFVGTFEIVITLDSVLYPSRDGVKVSTEPPVVYNVTPAILGGEVVTVNGRNFGASASVAAAGNVSITIDGILCLPLIYISDSELQCGPPPKISSRTAIVRVNAFGGLSSIPNATVSAVFPIIQRITPSFVWRGDLGNVHDFNVTGYLLDASTVISIGGANCSSVTVVSNSTVTCRNLPVHALNATAGIFASTLSGIRSDPAPQTLVILPRATVTAITPSSARPGASVLIEGFALGRSEADIRNVFLGDTQCTSWRYATVGSSILCFVGDGRGERLNVFVRFVDGPAASSSVEFTYIRDLTLNISWAPGSINTVALPSSPGSTALPFVPPLQLRITDDAGFPLLPSIAPNVTCYIAVDGTSTSTSAGLSSVRVFGGTSASVAMNTSTSTSGATFSTLAVEGAMGARLPLRVRCGIAPGPYDSSPVLDLTVARVVAVFSTTPSNGTLPTDLGATGAAVATLSPATELTLSVSSGRPLSLPESVASLIPCRIEAWPSTMSGPSMSVRVIGTTTRTLDANSDKLSFQGIGIAAPLGTNFKLFVSCSWLQNEAISALSTSISLRSIVMSWTGTPSLLPSVVQFNTFFSLPVLRILGQDGQPLSTLSSPNDLTCQIRVSSNDVSVAFIGGGQGPYDVASGAVSFKPIAVQPQLPDSEAIPVPLSLQLTCSVRGQTVPTSVTAPLSVFMSLQRLKIAWAIAPPDTAMPSSCGRSWNKTSLGGTLDAITGELSGGNIGALATTFTILPIISVTLNDFETGLPASAESGGTCTLSHTNVSFSSRTPIAQRYTSLGGQTLVFTRNGVAIFDSVALAAPLGSYVTLVASCSRASGGRAFTIAKNLALNDAEIEWITTASATANVLIGGRSVPVPAVAVVHNATTVLRATLKIRLPIFDTWRPNTPYTIKHYELGIDPAASCTLVLVRDAGVRIASGSTVLVPLDSTNTELFLIPGASSSSTLDSLAQPGASWSVGEGGAVSLNFRLVAPLDAPVAVQAYCVMGASTIMSTPIVLVASAARLSFSPGGSPPYGIIPTFDDDPVQNLIRPIVSFGLLEASGTRFLAPGTSSNPSANAACTIRVLPGSIVSSDASAQDLLTCTSSVELSSTDDSGNVITGSLQAYVDPLTGLAAFPNAFIKGPLGSLFTIRASCIRPAEGGPVSFVDTQAVLADIGVSWGTAEGYGLARTPLPSFVTLQADVPLQITAVLSWLIPFKRTSMIGSAPAPVRWPLNSTTATTVISAACSLRVLDPQVRTSSIFVEANDVPVDASGAATFKIRFIEPLSYPFHAYAVCEFNRGLKRSTPPLLITLVAPSPGARRIARNMTTPSPGSSSTASYSRKPLPSMWSIGTVTPSNSPSNSVSLTPTSTPSTTGSTSLILAVSKTTTPTAINDNPASETTSSSTASPAQPTPILKFDVSLSVPSEVSNVIFSGLQDSSVLKTLAEDVLNLMTRSSSSASTTPLNVRVASISNAITGQVVNIENAPAVRPARRLGGSSANLKVTMAATMQSTSAANQVSQSVTSIVLSETTMARSISALSKVSNVPNNSLTFLPSIEPGSILVMSPTQSATPSLSKNTLGSSSSNDSSLSSTLAGAAAGISVSVLIILVIAFFAYRAGSRHASVANFSHERRAEFLKDLRSRDDDYYDDTDIYPSPNYTPVRSKSPEGDVSSNRHVKEQRKLNHDDFTGSGLQKHEVAHILENISTKQQALLETQQEKFAELMQVAITTFTEALSKATIERKAAEYQQHLSAEPRIHQQTSAAQFFESDESSPSLLQSPNMALDLPNQVPEKLQTEHVISKAKDDSNVNNNINNNIADVFPSSIESSTPHNVPSDIAKQEALKLEKTSKESLQLASNQPQQTQQTQVGTVGKVTQKVVQQTTTSTRRSVLVESAKVTVRNI